MSLSTGAGTSSNIHYMFVNEKVKHTIAFNGAFLSLKQLKVLIVKKLGVEPDFDLKITNSVTKEVYDEEDPKKNLIEKNTSVTVARTRLAEGKAPIIPLKQSSIVVPASRPSDYATAEGTTEDDQLQQIMTNNASTAPTYKQTGTRVPTADLKCFQCMQSGHQHNECPLNKRRKTTGVP